MRETETYQQHTPAGESFYRRQQANMHARRWGIILLLTGTIWLVFELTGRGALVIAGLGFVERTRQVEQIVPGDTLIVDVVNDDIELVGWDRPDIQIEATGHAFSWNSVAAQRKLDSIRLEISRSGDTVQVQRADQPGLHVGRAPYASIRIALPAGADFRLKSIQGNISLSEVDGAGSAETTSGDIRADNTQGRLALHSVSGSIDVDGHNGILDLETASGDIAIDAGALRGVTARSLSGDLELEDVSGALAITTTSGDVDITDARGVQIDIESSGGDLHMSGSLAATGRQQISSVSGDVELYLPETSDLRFDISTLSGDLETDLELHQSIHRRRELRGVLGDGSATLHITTDSGDVGVYAR